MTSGLITALLLALLISPGCTQQRECTDLSPATPDVPNIVGQPTNETKAVGEMTFCECRVLNTPDYPFWRINETSYVLTSLPSNFEVNETGLIFNASATLHNTRFQCYFIICTQSEGCCEIRSRYGHLNVSQQVDPDPPLMDCEPDIIKIMVDDAQHIGLVTVTLQWIPAPNCLDTFSYIAKVATCLSPTTSPSTQCNVSSTSTDVDIDNSSCPFIIREITPLLFRVQTGPDSLTLGTAPYLYTNELNNTENKLVELGETIRIRRPGGILCNYGYQVCISGPSYNNCFTLNNLPRGHKDCTTDNIPMLCIDYDESLNGSVYTLLCQQVSLMDCRITAALDVLSHNFRVITNSTSIDTDSDDRRCGKLNLRDCIIATTVGSTVLALVIVTVVMIIICKCKRWCCFRIQETAE